MKPDGPSNTSTPFLRLSAHPEGPGSVLRISESNSFRGTIFNVFISIVGGGVLGLPYSLSHCGIVVGVVSLCIVGIFVDIMIWMLLVSMDVTRMSSYSTMVEEIYGPRLGVLVDVFVVLNNFGVIVAMLDIIGDLVVSFVGFLAAPALLHSRAVLLSIITLCMLLPLTLQRNMGYLRHLSLLNFVVASVVALVIIAMGTGLIDVSKTNDAEVVLVAGSPWEVVYPLSNMVFAFSCLMNIPCIYVQLRRKSSSHSRFYTKRSKMMLAVHLGMGMSAVFYIVVGAFGYLAFRDRVAQDVLSNLDYGTFGAAPYVSVSYSFVLCCAYPVNATSCSASLHRLLQHGKAAVHGAYNYKYRPFELWSPGNLSPFSSPSAIWSPAPAVPAEDDPAFTKASSTKNLGSDVDDVTLHFSLGRRTSSDSVKVMMQEEKMPPPSDLVRVIEATCLVAASLVTSLSVPGVSVVFALTGGLCSSALTFIFPCMCFLKVRSGLGGCCRLFLGYGLLLFGLLVAVATTGVTVVNMLS